MRKKTYRFLWLWALPLMLGLSACTDKDDNPAEGGVETVEQPDVTLPTDDQLSVRVTEDVPTAVLGTFDEGSTGAALVKRLPAVTDHIGPDTKLLLVPGSLFETEGGITEDDVDAMVRLSLNGGYLAIERPTGQQMLNFGVLYAAKLLELQQQEYEETFDLDATAARVAARSSQAAERFQTRCANLRQVAQTRAGGDALTDVQAEMVILGPTDYFAQEPFEEEMTSYVREEDSEGNATEPEAVTSRQERTAAVSGTLADAAADWLNASVRKQAERQQQSAPRRAQGVTRASGLNDLMDASEEFTYNETIDWRNWNNQTLHYANRVNMIVRSWGVHNMETNKDFYYLKQNVTLRLGDENGWKIYWPRDEYSWMYATNYGSYNYYYGSFLSQYETSINLTGSGSIRLEAAKPDTDNNTSSTSVSFGSSSSKTETLGMTWGGTASASPGINVGGSYSVGTTTGTSFSLSMSQTSKDLHGTKNTSGNKVTWTYKGTLPQFMQPLESDNKYHYKHQIAADILTNDCDVANEICWSVTNPSGQYTFNITSDSETAALLHSTTMGSAGNRRSTYVYSTQSANHTQQLLQPNRATQKWRMSITVDEWANGEVANARTALQDEVRKQFNDVYADDFTVADKTAQSLDVINYVVNYSKRVFTNSLADLQDLGKSKGVKRFSIHWRSDNGLQTREPFVVEVPKNGGKVAQAVWCIGNNTLYFVNASQLKAGDTWGGQTITMVWSGAQVTDTGSGEPWWTVYRYKKKPSDDYYDDMNKTIQRVVFDQSFADACPQSLFGWFVGYSNLTSIEGMEHLNTSEVGMMNYMFSGCEKLTTVNVDGFDMSKVADVGSMFYNCKNLTTIYCNEKWNVKYSSGMFSGCDKLRGAVGYDGNRTDCSMANPSAGYFSFWEDTSLPNVYIKDGQNNSDLLKQYVGKTVNVRYSRSLQAKVGSDGNYTPTPYTVCLPYDLDITEAVQSGQVRVYTLGSIWNGQFGFEPLNVTKLTAGVPYVLRVYRGKLALSAKGVKIATAEPKSSKVYASPAEWNNGRGVTVGDWMGTFDQMDADEAVAWDVFALKSNGKWDYYSATGTGSVPAFRAFLSSDVIDEKEYSVYYDVFAP